MTVLELRDILAELPDDLAVLGDGLAEVKCVVLLPNMIVIARVLDDSGEPEQGPIFMVRP